MRVVHVKVRQALATRKVDSDELANGPSSCLDRKFNPRKLLSMDDQLSTLNHRATAPVVLKFSREKILEIIIIIIDRFYIALFSALGQTHCARM